MYDRRTVELLVPAIWDEEFAYGIRDEYAPDPEMPKATPDKKTSNTLYAMLADIRQAWKRADIPQVQRQALFLRFFLDWELKDIGYNQRVDKSTAMRRVEAGVGRMTAWLNGDQYCDGYEPSLDEMEAAAA